MKIQSIKFKNFASYGNSIQEITFENDISELFLTLGKNGHGKTTIANAIVYALYGKVEGIKMADLPNRINKELWVEIKLKCGNIEVEIERGFAPSVFKVSLNDVEFDKAGKRSVQEYLEEEVYGIPYHVFKNIIILSVNDFKSFLPMSNHDKKQIVDRMFGFSILNEMQQNVKEQRKNLKADITLFDRELTQITENIQQVNVKLNELMEESDAKNKERINELKESLRKYVNNKKTLEDAQEKIKEKLGIFNDTLSESQTNEWQLTNELKILRKKLKLYESNACPTCESPLTTDFHQDRKQEILDQEQNLPLQIKAASDSVTDIKNQIQSLQTKDHSVREKVSALNTNIGNLKRELLKIKDSLGDVDNFSHLQQIIKDFEAKEIEKSAAKDTINSEYYFLENLEEILGEDGVKNLAVKTILPGLNTNIAAMGQTMHLPFQIRFDEKFNCIINHLGEEINPMTLSTGERKKADFIIIIAIIKILKLRFPQLNLLFLDELLSSVDADGVHNILKILSQVIKETGLNTFIINHTELPRELFDRQIQIYRENGFSKFTIEKIE